MTTSHVEKFAELVGKAPALLAKLGLDKVNADAAAATVTASAAAFISNAVKEAKEKPKRSQREAKALGIEFIKEEFRGKRRTIRYAVGSRGGRAEKHR